MNRIVPKVGPEGYRTWRIVSPPDRTVVAACEQVGCPQWRNGWDTVTDERTDDGYVTEAGQRVGGAVAAAYIRQRSGRTFREMRTETGLTVFRFEAGQRCFAEHRTRPERFAVVGGDWRGNPRRELLVHARPEDWVEHMQSDLDRIATARERG